MPPPLFPIAVIVLVSIMVAQIVFDWGDGKNEEEDDGGDNDDDSDDDDDDHDCCTDGCHLCYRWH